jgi:hypothetical protein
MVISNINTDLLSDTLNIMQLAKQAAIARGNQERAEKLSSVAEGLYRVATGTFSDAKVNNTEEAPETALTDNNKTQDSFHTLFDALQSGVNLEHVLPASQVIKQIFSSGDRTLMVMAMSASGKNELDIARQFRITRDEVRSILSLNTTKETKDVSNMSEEK